MGICYQQCFLAVNCVELLAKLDSFWHEAVHVQYSELPNNSTRYMALSSEGLHVHSTKLCTI